MTRMTTMILVLLSLLILTSACDQINYDVPGKCSSWCDQQEECSEDVEQVFSRTGCELNCTIAYENADYADCMDEYKDVLDCEVDLSCKDWEVEERQQECDDEYEDYNDCLQDYLD